MSYDNYRLKISDDKDIVFKHLKDKFITKFNLYIFALSLGVKQNKRVILENKKSEPISITLFGDNHKKFMDIVVLNETKNIDSLDLSNEENFKNYFLIIEEYTNGGLEIIKNIITKHLENGFELLKDEFYSLLSEEIPMELEEELEW